ncbi:MAG: hypothetical protein PHQ67_05480 [Fermentimonas sp.]|nr:hypothetical protein [Fermentimonas sp.]MDD4009246.1 hypothetical protein [Fermentimonas sp.]MDD4697022.1 hypothetical protein [Fermentimonas sp.]
MAGTFALRVDANNEIFQVSLVNNSLPLDAADRFQLLVVQRDFPLYANSWNGDAIISAYLFGRDRSECSW